MADWLVGRCTWSPTWAARTPPSWRACTELQTALQAASLHWDPNWCREGFYVSNFMVWHLLTTQRYTIVHIEYIDDISPFRREAGKTGWNLLPVMIFAVQYWSSTHFSCSLWNLHDIGGVGEKAECQPQGITSHSIASWPGCNDAKLCTDLFGIKFSSSLLVFSLRFDVLLYNDVTWQWSARSTATSRFWFLGHSTHNNNRILFRTSSYPDTRPIFDQT